MGLFIAPTHTRRFEALGDQAREAVTVHWLEGLISNAAGMPQWLKEALIAMFGEGIYYEAYGSTEAGIVTSIGPYGADSGRSDFGLDEWTSGE
ncbi:hypothetical protein [Qipengyuania sp.]|uniref:hypothetical protein n=1 Tax=Qipengyuania sp. TaxID=2004515 RepID=UPI003BAB4A92